MKKPRGGLSRRKLAALSLSVGVLASLPAAGGERESPWGLLRTAALWQGEAFSVPRRDPGKAGFGARGGFELRGLAADSLALALGISYRWRETGETVQTLPGLDLEAGWRLRLAGQAALQPFAALAAEAGQGLSLRFGAAAQLRLRGADWLSLVPSAALPFGDPGAFRLSLALGLRREASWLVPVPPAKAEIRAEPELFSPDGDALSDTVRLWIHSRHRSSVSRWDLSVVDASGSPFRRFSGSGSLPKSLLWDGLSESGELPNPGEDYLAVLETRDHAGREESSQTRITCDILIVPEGDTYKIRVPAIRFPSNSFTLNPRESRELYEANKAVLQRIGALFLRFPDYSLIVEGHANPVWRGDPERFEREQRTELIPLSEKRAETVRQALVLAGIEENRIRTDAKGGLEPLSDAQDPRSVAKNRRVEFILVRNP